MKSQTYLWMFIAVMASGGLAAAADQDQKKQPTQTQQVYLLVAPDEEGVWELPPKDLFWKTLHKLLDDKAGRLIQVADRDQVDSSCYFDVEGLRLYVSDRKCRDKLRQLSRASDQQITPAYLIRSLLSRRYSETGIEPDRIPVSGEAGKECGVEGMVHLKGGEYERPGRYYTSQSAELGERSGDRYKVKVPKFYIDKYKVTNEQYCRFLNDGNPGYWNSAPWSNITRDEVGQFVVEDGKAKWPVIAVNWYQAAGYAEWAGKRLPTEAEWEFAAGGPEGRKYPWGNEPPDPNRGYSLTSGDYMPVDAFPAGATPDGIFGLAGNAAEWCADFYSHENYDKAPDGGLLTNPRGPTMGNPDQGYPRMFKGFCQGRSPELLTCTKRHARAPLLTAAIGFRCVKGCT